jgi:hypothetical protein
MDHRFHQTHCYATMMKNLIFTLFSLFLLSSCSSVSYDDQSVFLSSETSEEIYIVEIYNREADAKDAVAIRVQDTEQESVILKPHQVATLYLDESDAGKKEPVLVFVLPSGEEIKSVLPSGITIDKNTPPKFYDKVYICIENGVVSQLSSEEWYGKLNKDREASPTERVLMLVTAPITVPIFLASYMTITLVGPLVE